MRNAFPAALQLLSVSPGLFSLYDRVMDQHLLSSLSDSQTNISWRIHCWKKQEVNLHVCQVAEIRLCYTATPHWETNFAQICLFQWAANLIAHSPHRAALGWRGGGSGEDWCGGPTSHQTELELCVTCKGEAPECDNSWLFKVKLFQPQGEGGRKEGSEGCRKGERKSAPDDKGSAVCCEWSWLLLSAL